MDKTNDSKKKESELGITVKKSEDFSEWYTQTILNNNDNPKIEIWLQTKAKIQKQGFTGTPWEEVE